MSDLSIATYTASGAANVQYAVPFDYLNRQHVRVLVGYIRATRAYSSELWANNGFIWINDTTIQIPTLAAATVFSIVRQTPSDQPLVDWVQGSGGLTIEELRIASLQALYLAQEQQDQAAAAGSINEDTLNAVAAASVQAAEALAIAEALESAIISSVPDNSITTPKLVDGAVTQAKTDAGVQASLAKADSAIQQAALDAALAGSGFIGGFRNAIINGSFDLWQRGTLFSSIEGHGPDQWFLRRAFSSLETSQQVFAVGQTDVPGQPRFYVRHVVASAVNNGSFAVMAHAIEDVRRFSGEEVTLSFWAKADAARPISIEFVQSFGTGGSPSAEVDTIGVTKLNLTTDWAQYTVTVTLPSITGKALGTTANTSFVGFNVWMDAGSNLNSRTDSLGRQSGTFDFGQFQLEQGAAATVLEQRPLGLELMLAERYYQKGTVSHWGYGAAGNTVGVTFQFRTTMRRAPVVTLSGGTGTNILGVGTVFVWPDGFDMTGAVFVTGSTFMSRDYAAESALIA